MYYILSEINLQVYLHVKQIVGASLASIHSNIENELVQISVTCGDAWIGLNSFSNCITFDWYLISQIFI